MDWKSGGTARAGLLFKNVCSLVIGSTLLSCVEFILTRHLLSSEQQRYNLDDLDPFSRLKESPTKFLYQKKKRKMKNN